MRGAEAQVVLPVKPCEVCGVSASWEVEAGAGWGVVSVCSEHAAALAAHGWPVPFEAARVAR